MELETHSIISQKLGCIESNNCSVFQKYIEEIGNMINQLINSLKKSMHKY